MSLGKKLFLIIFLNICCALALACVAFIGLMTLSEAQNDLMSGTMALSKHMGADMMHDALRGDVLSSLYISSGIDKDVGKKEDISADLEEHALEFKEAIKSLESSSLSPEVSKAIAELKEPLNSYIHDAQEIYRLAFSNRNEAVSKYPNFLHSFSVLEEKMGAASEIIEASLSEASANALSAVPRVKLSMTIALFIALALGLISLLTMNKTVTRILREQNNNLLASSHKLLISAKQVSASSHSLAERATEQAASLEETASSLEELSSTSKHNSNNSKLAEELSQGVFQVVQQGVQSVAEMSDAIVKIKQSADEVTEIVKIIEDIAFQTNLLALNAAVEAARAGDAGKGFAVVAEEVSNLAKRSSQAAKKSSEKIINSKNLAENGIKASNLVAESFNGINSNISKSVDLIKEIAASSKEQTTGIGHINTAINELDKVTQENSASAEESSAASSELTEQADNLNQIISRIAVIIDGGKKSHSVHTNLENKNLLAINYKQNTLHGKHG